MTANSEQSISFAERFIYGPIELVANFVWGGSWGNHCEGEWIASAAAANACEAGAIPNQIIPPAIAPMVVLLLGAGLFFMIALKGRPLRRLFPAFGELWAGRKGQGTGEITPWQALSTALSGQVGTGNLAGVATALTLGGPGAIFWMWVTAIFGMALAFAESSLAVRFREKHPDGHIHGGPMYYIKNGLGKKWGWLAILFCLGTLFSATATGGMIQSNSITQSVVETANLMGVQSSSEMMGVNIINWIVGAVIAALVFAVIIGGIKSIGSVAGKVVPFMAIAYVIVALFVIILNIDHIGSAFGDIFGYAFGLKQAAGGLAGYGMVAAMRYGVARGLFSNEAGQGSAPIAHAAAQTNDPVRQGEIASIGVFIDTIVICTMTALVILVVDGSYGINGSEYAWHRDNGLEASAVTTAAYATAIPFGNWVVTIAIALFAFTTMIGWSYYAETAITYMIGDWAARPFRFIWVAIVFIGALQPVNAIWRLGDLANASMAIPNIIAIVALSGVVFAMARKADKGERTEPGVSAAEQQAGE